MASIPEHNEIIYGNRIPGIDVRYEDLFRLYCDSPYGQYHAEQPLRYGRFSYDRATMLADLGDDVHPVRHGSYTESSIIRPFLAEQNYSGDERFTSSQIVTLRVAGLVHDIGECEHPELLECVGQTVGDIQWDLKTDADALCERAIRQYLYQRLYPNIPSDAFEPVDDVVDNKVGSLPREAFDAIEKLGYYTTGLQAGRVALELHKNRTDADELRFIQLGSLAIAVTNGHREALRGQSFRFPYIATILTENERLDERIHTSLQ